jgi:hypothetical protein
MGQAKIRGSFEQRRAQGIAKQENEAWRLNQIIDKEFERINRQRRQKFLPHITKSFLAEHVYLKD